MGELLVLVGSLFVLVAAVGVLRFHDPLARLHAVSKASTLGVLLVLAGTAVVVPALGDRMTLVLAMLLQLSTSPVSASVIGRSVYQAGRRATGGAPPT